MAFCERCGSVIQSDAAFCGACGASLKRSSANSSVATAAVQERELFNRNDILVTDSRLIVHGQTYSVNAISSVVGTRTLKPMPWAVGCFWLGVILVGATLLHALAGETQLMIRGIVYGLVLVALGSIVIVRRKADYSAEITVMGQQPEPICKSKDKEMVEDLVNAINEALVLQGSRVA